MDPSHSEHLPPPHDAHIDDDILPPTAELDPTDPLHLPPDHGDEHDHHLDLQNAINALNPSDIPPHLHPALNINPNVDDTNMNINMGVGVGVGDGVGDGDGVGAGLLPEEMGEQMELFWGAVSSAFGNVRAGEGVGEGSRRDEEEVEGVMEDVRVEGEEGQGQGQQDGDGVDLEPGQGQGQGQDSEQREGGPPRNEWEHVQLLMSLGGQLGEDLASGITAQQEGGATGEGTAGGEGSQAGVGEGAEGSRRPDGALTMGEGSGNAEAGPSNYAGEAEVIAGAGDPTTGKKGKKSRRASTKSKSTNPKSGSKSTPTNPDDPSSASAAATKARNLLTLAERKANHVSSEQRRRNAIRIGYAELGALEHLSVNGVWPETGDLKEVVEASRGMEGMEDLVGRKRGREEMEGEGEGEGAGGSGEGNEGNGDGTGEGDGNLNGAESQTLAEGESNGATAPPPSKKKKAAQLRSKKGMSFENAKEPVSKSTILQKAADLAQWMTLGNEWLAGEVERLERLLGVEAGAVLEVEVDVGGSNGNGEGEGGEAGYMAVGDQEVQQDGQMEQAEENNGNGEGDIQAVQQAVTMAEDHATEPRIEDHFVETNGQFREAEELGPDGYPRDMY